MGVFMTRVVKPMSLCLATSMVALLAAGVPVAAAAQTADQQANAQPCADGTIPTADQPCPTDNSTEGASTEGASAGEVVVTGSRIAQRYGTVEPVQTLSSADIEARGFNTLGQALNELPSFGVPDSSPVGLQSSFGPAQSFVNFFGLGSQRTLTLVNGHRFVGSNTAAIFGPTGSGGDQVDLNVIPTKLIDRVETVAVGGAPIYGSDAIAGTINVILKKNYDGVDADAQTGITEYGDSPSYRFRVLAGHNFAGGRGNITFAGEYNQQKGLLYTDRYLPGLGRYYDSPTTANYPFKQQFYTDRRIPGVSDTGIPIVGTSLGIVAAPEWQQLYGDYYFGGQLANGAVRNGTPTSAMKFDDNGNLIPIDFGLSTSVTNSSGGNGYSLTDLSNLLTNTKRYSSIVTGSYELTDHIRFTGEAWYTHSEGTNLRDQPEYNAGLFGDPGDSAGGVVLSVNNPFLKPAARQTILDEIANNPFSDQNMYGFSQDYFVLDRANTDITTGRARGQVDIYRFVASLDGDFTLFGDKQWKWEVSGDYGHSTTKSRTPEINFQNFENAVGEITDDNPNGIPCLAGLENSSGPTISSTCAPLDLFGTNQATQAAKNYVTMIATPKSVNTEKDFVASLTGPLLSLPGGDLSIALGYEHREEHENFSPGAADFGAPDPDPTVDSNGDGDPTNDRVSYGQTVPIAPINAGYKTNELFGEVQADLIGPDQNIPLINSLNFQGAVRYVHHSVNGGAWTYTLGGRWGVLPDLTFRGNYTRSIRSPSITEAQNPAQSYFGFADDPCDYRNRDNGSNPTGRNANCVAALTAAGLDDDQIANFQALSAQRSFPQAVAGDTTLRNETANSWTVGTILQPRLVPGLVMSIDYVNIKVKDVITSLSSDDVLNDCYDSTTYPDNPFCSRITRDSDGQISYILTGYANADQLHYRGIVANLNYRVHTPFLGARSSVGLGVSYQHLFELSTTTEGTKTETAGDAGYSKNKGVLSLTYDNGDGFGYFAQLDYIGPAQQDVTYAPDYRPHNYYNSVMFTNMGISYDVNKKFSLQLNVDNVFGTKPPYPSSGTSTVYFDGIYGRFFRFGAAVHF